MAESPSPGRLAPSVWAWPALLLLVFVWFLSEEWTLNPQYFYGWGVPILGMLVFRQRWAERPNATAAPGKAALIAALVAGMMLWLPIRIVREANMDWRLLQWVMGGGAVAALLAGFYWMGGKSWLRHFAFAGLFLLVAVPWPTRLEQLVIQFSTEWVIRGAVEILRWLGIAAWRSGSVIQLPETAVGVDEACSGLRSLQGSLMCALFLGEVLRLSWPRRAALLAMGAGVAAALNLIRTVVLTAIAARRGAAEASAWHDGTGLTTLGISFALLWLVARVLRPRRAEAVEPDRADQGGGYRRIALPVTLACAGWLLLVEGASELWFRSREREPARTVWTFHPEAVSDLRNEPIPERTQAILRYNRGEAYRRSLADGTEWWIYALAWDRDGGGSPLARFHSPDICLPAAGVKLVGQGRSISPLGEAVPFRSFEFEWLEKPVYLFSSFVSSSGDAAVTSMDQFDLTWQKRLRLALAGERPAEQKVFQVVIAGARSRGWAEEVFRDFANQTLRTAP